MNEATFAPPPEWMAAFEKQSVAALTNVDRYANLRALSVRKLGGVVIGKELVLDALGDTLMGTLPWDPARVSLTRHVRDAVGMRVKDQIRRLGRLRHLPMVGDLDSGDGLDLVEGAASRRVAQDDADAAAQLAVRATAASVMAAMRRLAGDDVIVLRILEAMTAGFFERGEIIEITAMSSAEYDNGRRRMVRLSDQLPEGVRIGARLLFV